MPSRLDRRAITTHMTARLDRQEWAPGDQLPTQRDLAVQYRVSESTMKWVLDILRDRGRLESRQGVGWFVAE